MSDKGSLTAEEFAKLLGLSVLLSKERYGATEADIARTAHLVFSYHIETTYFSSSFLICRLLLAEKMGHLCRDDSVEGLRFYPNLF